ncbi:two-component system regulatory protein YycI [Oceanobacillus bengalensis]|uniref:Regulatory protein YycH-like domain-containing protein n=1 Tax=Oceanobacillus bengalensis TaxID=1435466 RepID=A0A494YZQ7_9BACI|nr:two-component system regulatory protein YycI [Oceanobacillus bengalensis]RKQ15205.1 hypothetical protein D8M05_10755 [Oceanobacillus bengalensis]
MQWGHIKTLFILSFLLLDIYLLLQFIDKTKEADFGILDRQEASIEDQLQAENISINADLEMNNVTEETYILASQESFEEVEIAQLEGLKGQTSTVISNKFIVSQFDRPIAVDKDISQEGVNQLLVDKVLHYDAYTFWDWNKDLNIMIFFQKQGIRPVYFNENGILLVYLNSDNEMTHYTQTLLGEPKPQGGGTKALIPPIEAIEVLYNNNHLKPDDAITDVGIGYYSRFTSEVEQVFAPTWRVTVNEERNYFVNAMEGFVFSSNDMTFLQETVSDIMMKLHALNDENEVKEPFLNILQQMLETENRSEEE